MENNIEKDEIPFYDELVEAYKRGELKPKNEGTAWLRFYISEESKKYGEKFAIFCPFKQFLLMMELNKKIEEEKFKILFKEIK